MNIQQALKNLLDFVISGDRYDESNSHSIPVVRAALAAYQKEYGPYRLDNPEPLGHVNRRCPGCGVDLTDVGFVEGSPCPYRACRPRKGARLFIMKPVQADMTAEGGGDGETVPNNLDAARVGEVHCHQCEALLPAACCQ